VVAVSSKRQSTALWIRDGADVIATRLDPSEIAVLVIGGRFERFEAR